MIVFLAKRGFCFRGLVTTIVDVKSVLELMCNGFLGFNNVEPMFLLL